MYGILTAIVTPFKNQAVDIAALEKLVDWQINQGIHGIVPCGTTGESPTLSLEEHAQVVRTCVDVAQGRVPIIVGVGSNNTAYSVQLAQQTEKLGADGFLVVNPYYNKPTQEGLYSHYQTIHDATNLPIIIYNTPSRSGGEILLPTVARLAELARVVGIKDTSDLTRCTELRQLVGHEFYQFTGNDEETLAFLALGGHGCISATSNIAPALCVAFYDAWQRGEVIEARRLFEKLYPLHRALFCETSPGPVKYAAFKLGLCPNDAVRLPLVTLRPDSQARVDKVLAEVLGHG